jgi:Tfp pilus assembly ATPase PilU
VAIKNQKPNAALDKAATDFNVKKITQIYADDRKLQVKQDRSLNKRGLPQRRLWSLDDREDIDRLIRDAYDEP